MMTTVWLFKPRSHGRKRKVTRACNGGPLPGRNGWSQDHPPSVSRKNTTRTSFVQMGAAEPTKAPPQPTEGTATAAGRPEARFTRGKGGRRRPEAAGGGRRRPETKPE